MYRCAFSAASAAVLAIALAAPASAQPQRAFTPQTLRGEMVFGDYPAVRLNGKAATLSPGSRVRSRENMIVMAASLAGTKEIVNYTLDISGTQLQDVWLLRPEEAANRPWPRTLDEAAKWTFDPSTQTWAKP